MVSYGFKGIQAIKICQLLSSLMVLFTRTERVIKESVKEDIVSGDLRIVL